MGRWYQLKDANWRIPYTGGWCLKYVREAFGQPAVYQNATTAWKANDFPRKTGYPPAGITVPVYFSLGSTPLGHVAIRLDDLMVASSTQSGTHPKGYLHPNIQDLITMYAKYNQGCTYLGWKEGIGKTRFVEYRPDITKKNVTTETVIPFETTSIEDDTVPAGKVITKVTGVNGLRTVVTEITYSDGKESSRKVVSDKTKDPVTQQLVVGTYVEVPVIPEPPVVEPVPEQPEPVEPELPIKPINISWLINLIKWLINLIRRTK